MFYFSNLEQLYGRNIWNYIIIGASFWSYSEEGKYLRKKSGITEDSWKDKINQQIKNKFELSKDLDFVFIDSWAKSPYNELFEDHQQTMFLNESSKLWEFIQTHPEPLVLKTVEYLALENKIQVNSKY